MAAAGMKGERLLLAPQVPELDGLVLAGRDEALAVPAEGDAARGAGVPLERENFLGGARVPDTHRLVPAARGQPLAIRTEGHRRNVAALPGKPECFLEA